MPLSNYTELCALEVKTFIPHDILNIQHKVNLFGQEVHSYKYEKIPEIEIS